MPSDSQLTFTFWNTVYENVYKKDKCLFTKSTW
jgi:hypothetical protein